MLQFFKNLLKNIIPPPINVFNREINRIIRHNEKNAKQISNLLNIIERLSKENNIYKAQLLNIDKKIQLLQKSMKCCEGYASETVWAEIFNNIISDSSWLSNTAFAAGRWAVGYQYLYVMYRILNEIHPQRILDLGLGQSTRMIGQYASSHENVTHFVVEHDPVWIDFFKKDFVLSERSQIMQLDREMEPYKEAAEVRVFKNFTQQFKGEKFDFISIDAPLGGDMKQYSRIDVLKLLPGCLADSFIIMIDDTQRPGEAQTVKEMKRVLEENGIAYATGRYSGVKDCTVISSINLKFVCSM